MTANQPFRQCISTSNTELIIYATDNFSQFPQRDDVVRSKCERGLAVACQNDLVVLRGELDLSYYNWLRSLGLGSDHVVAYNAQTNHMSLSELIVQNPEPVMECIQRSGKQPVYVPWFSGQMETETADILGASLFGASESATLTYNDKASFKKICLQLQIPMVNGDIFNMNPGKADNFLAFNKSITRYLSGYETVIIRGTLGESGMSLYKTNGSNLTSLYQQIVDSGEKTIIIESFLTVSSSPNDQWAISRDGTITHLGIRDQLCESGMVHVGTVNQTHYLPEVAETIKKTSMKIVNHMAENGYVGIAGIDYIVSDEGIYPVENNARFNGSSYVSLIVENIETPIFAIPHWKFMKIKTSACTFTELTQRVYSILYDGQKENSVFPFNCDDLPETGSLSVILFAQDLSEMLILENTMNTLLAATADQQKTILITA